MLISDDRLLVSANIGKVISVNQNIGKISYWCITNSNICLRYLVEWYQQTQCVVPDLWGRLEVSICVRLIKRTCKITQLVILLKIPSVILSMLVYVLYI